MATNLPDVGTYAAADVLTALNANSRNTRYRYQVLDYQGNVRGLLAGVQEGGKVTYNFLADVKRTCSFQVAEAPRDVPTGWLTSSDVNYVSNLLKPYLHVQMPDGNYAEFSLGVFLMSATDRRAAGGRVVRSISGYDKQIILKQDLVASRYVVALGANVVASITGLLDTVSWITYDITPSVTTMPAAQDWDPGTPKSKIVQDLLTALNYRSLWWDENGVARSSQYIVPTDRSVDYTYTNGITSVVAEEATDSLDLWDVPNTWVFTASQPNQTVLVSTFVNGSPASPNSTWNRGRIVTRFDSTRQEVTQAALDAAVRAQAHTDSQAVENISFSTPLMPFHGENTVLKLTHTELALTDVFSETQWEMTLSPGAPMTHTVRRSVDVG